MHEAVDNGTDKCMILEWLDHDLWEIHNRKLQSESLLPKIVAKSVLKAIVAFSDMDGQGVNVHTGVFYRFSPIDI